MCTFNLSGVWCCGQRQIFRIERKEMYRMNLCVGLFCERCDLSLVLTFAVSHLSEDNRKTNAGDTHSSGWVGDLTDGTGSFSYVGSCENLLSCKAQDTKSWHTTPTTWTNAHSKKQQQPCGRLHFVCTAREQQVTCKKPHWQVYFKIT